MRIRTLLTGALILLAATVPTHAVGQSQPAATILNVSFDPTRELYTDFNAAFARYWKPKSEPSRHRSAIQRRFGRTGARDHHGLPADVVTLALGYDIESSRRWGS